MIAALSAWHPHYHQAAGAIGGRLAGGDTMVLAGPALVETYSVLTRLPPPHRLSPTSGIRLLQSFEGNAAELVALDGDAYVRLVRSAAERGIAGGGIYDAVIGACGVAAGVDAILTFNDRQFRRLGLTGIEIVVPA